MWTLLPKSKWESLFSSAMKVALAIVREFYASVPSWTSYTSHVRGIDIDFKQKVINNILGTLRHRGADGNNIIENPYEEHLSAAIQLISKANTTWRISACICYALQPSYIDEEASRWLYMVKNRIMPTTHVSTIQRKGVMLIYCMMQIMTSILGRLFWRK